VARTDVLTPEQRSFCMSRVRSRDTRPELRLRRALWAAGLRYRLRSRLPGKPDLVFPSKRVAVFMDSCFWHRCPLHGTKPKTNAAFWEQKLSSNVRRDRRVNAELAGWGWVVLRVWQHELKDGIAEIVERVMVALDRDGPQIPKRGALMNDHRSKRSRHRYMLSDKNVSRVAETRSLS
jgi:DNA mismatch endonuclease (patch repair protein)